MQKQERRACLLALGKADADSGRSSEGAGRARWAGLPDAPAFFFSCEPAQVRVLRMLGPSRP